MVLHVGGTARVNGTLSVSRAIGDAKDKKYIIGEADVAVHTMAGNEEYLVIACDGIWDVVDGDEMTECVTKHFLSGGKKQALAKAICDFARDEGSSDNLTAIVVFFSKFVPPQQVEKTEEKSVKEETDGKDEEESKKEVTKEDPPSLEESSS